MRPRMYTYEAGMHCPDCARARFGEVLDNDDVVDNEGSAIMPVYSWDLQTGDYCEDCLTLAVEPMIRQQVPFVEWMISNLDGEDLRLIQREGCVVGIPGMITYLETSALYAAFHDDVWDGLADFAEQIGRPLSALIGSMLGDGVGNHAQFANAMVWMAAEWYRDLVEEERALRQIVR